MCGKDRCNSIQRSASPRRSRCVIPLTQGNNTMIKHDGKSVTGPLEQRIPGFQSPDFSANQNVITRATEYVMTFFFFFSSFFLGGGGGVVCLFVCFLPRDVGCKQRKQTAIIECWLLSSAGAKPSNSHTFVDLVSVSVVKNKLPRVQVDVIKKEDLQKKMNYKIIRALCFRYRKFN